MRAHAYIDGFNLYHGALEKRPACRWLDLRKLCVALLPPTCKLEELHYYTARMTEAGKAQRQDVYLRALRGECAPFFYKKGRFQRKALVLPRVDDGTDVAVRLLQEKQSDVNLAVQLIADACDRRMEAALVITDDSDQEGALRMAREECGLFLVIASPRGNSGLARVERSSGRKAGSTHRNVEAARRAASSLASEVARACCGQRSNPGRSPPNDGVQ